MTTSNDVPQWKRYLSPRFLASKVQERGVSWFAHAIWQVAWSNLALRTRPIRTHLWRVHDDLWYRGKKQPDVLYAFYDLSTSAVTFDIVAFLVQAELARKKAGYASLHVVIVPGPNEGFSMKKVALSTEDKQWRLRNILVPCCWLIPSCQRVTVCTSREEAMAFQVSLVKNSFPKQYSLRAPWKAYSISRLIEASTKDVIPSIQATPSAIRFVSDWIQAHAGERKVITITLRECSYERDRNSNLKDWGTFARKLDQSVYFPVVIRDIETTLYPLPPDLNGLTVFPEVVWNIELRAALYELSYLNMMVNNGPAILCTLNTRTRYLMFKMITPSGRATREEDFRRLGLEPGSQLRWATPFQRWVWEDDRLEVIQQAFREMCDRIERSSAVAP